MVSVNNEPMASIGIIGINSKGYFIKKCEGLLLLGTSNKSGIKSRLRKESSLKPKTRTKTVIA